MSFKNKIETLETEIKALGERLCEILVSIQEPYQSFLSFLKMDFSGNSYPAAIDSVEWWLEKHRPTFPKPALELWVDIKNKSDSARQFYALERQSDGGYQNPIKHMNVLMEADDDIPDGFGKRYGISDGAVKCLWLVDPTFEERFIRKRIAAAVARNGSRTGHYIFTKRRYKFSEAQAKHLVDDIWKNPNIVSRVFHEMLNWDKLVRCRIAQVHQEETLQVRADFGMPDE